VSISAGSKARASRHVAIETKRRRALSKYFIPNFLSEVDVD
jgi:hypothetical protein